MSRTYGSVGRSTRRGEVKMHMRRLGNRRGQGMLEYILVLTMALAAILYAVGHLNSALHNAGGTGYFNKMEAKIGTIGDTFKLAE